MGFRYCIVVRVIVYNTVCIRLDIDYSLDLFPKMLAHPRKVGQEIVSHPIGPGPMHVVLGTVF